MAPQKTSTPLSIVSTQNNPVAKTTPATLQSLLASVNIKKRFEDVLGKESAGFISSILSLANSNALLKTAEPLSIISAAAIAASLKLPINPNLGFAYIVPYKDGKSGKTIAQFQMGYKGYVQLAIRTGQYKTIAATEIYDGELIRYNRLTGDMEIDETKKTSNKVVGYYTYFKLMTGFEKSIYMSAEQVRAHAERYSKSFGKSFGPWKTNFDAMALKTPLKLLLSKWGILSIDMQKAIQTDQAVVDVTENGEESVTYADNTGDVISGEAIDVDQGDANSGDAQEPVDDDTPKAIQKELITE